MEIYFIFLGRGNCGKLALYICTLILNIVTRWETIVTLYASYDNTDLNYKFYIYS